MNLMARPCDLEPDPALDADLSETDCGWLMQRVVNALLREDVRSCVSSAQLVDNQALPRALLPAGVAPDQRWLYLHPLPLAVTGQPDGLDRTSGNANEHISEHISERAHEHTAAPADSVARLWIPVAPCQFMQRWQLSLAADGSPLPLIWCNAHGCRTLGHPEQVIHAFSHGLSGTALTGFTDFAAECQLALRQHALCQQARNEYWHSSAARSEWWQRMLHYERLAAGQDHPFYPSARAKVGFDDASLRAYAPEFGPRFMLHWLALPHALWQPQGKASIPGWPEMSTVGLPAALAQTHTLVPVHPFLWHGLLEHELQHSQFDDVPLAQQVRRAPKPALWVTPTLSVRSLMLIDAPAWHIKLPLPLSTLGTRNFRLIAAPTIADGASIQRLLGTLLAQEPQLGPQVLLTDESNGGHCHGHKFLAMILRHYPEAELQQASVVPVAGLCAPNADGRPVLAHLVDEYYAGDSDAFWQAYMSLTLRLHLTLWLRYGIALESNQQNSLLVWDREPQAPHRPRLRLLLKDNDAARIDLTYLRQRWPRLAALVAQLQEPRIAVDDALPLAQMFTTITLQLNLAALLENLHWPDDTPGRAEARKQVGYTLLRQTLEQVLQELADAGESVEAVAFARQILQQADTLYLKRLLVAATLVDKPTSGARDINKYYGHSAPNFMREPQ